MELQRATEIYSKMGKTAFKKRLPSTAIGDLSRVETKGGIIHYRIYQQDGSMQPMTCPDTLDNRLFVSWVQKFDRYSAQGIVTEGEDAVAASGAAQPRVEPDPTEGRDAPVPSPLKGEGRGAS